MSDQSSPSPGTFATAVSRTPEAPRERANKVEIHEFLVEDLSDQRKTLIDFAFRHGAFICLLLGWIVTSKAAHDLITQSNVVRFGLTSIIIVYATMYVGWVLGQLTVSRNTLGKLNQNGYMEQSLYSHLTISSALAWSYIVMHCVLCFAMTMFILS